MEPANILFVIAFIGLPIVFAIWALASRRELNRIRPPRERRDTPEPPQQPVAEQLRQEPAQPPQPVPSSESPAVQETRPLPVAAQQPPQPGAAEQETRPAPVVQQTQPAETVEQETRPAPIVQPQFGVHQPTEPLPVVAAPEPEPQPASSGTTEEYPIIEMPDSPRPPEPAAPPAASGSTDEFPIIEMPDSPRPAEPAPIEEQRLIIPAHREPTPAPRPGPQPVLTPLRRKPFYPPRYASRSGGVVKRLTPRAAQSFLGPKVGLRRTR